MCRHNYARVYKMVTMLTYMSIREYEFEDVTTSDSASESSSGTTLLILIPRVLNG